MPALIHIDALGSKKPIKGEVKRVNKYPEPATWASGGVKDFATIIEIKEPPSNIRSGMSAQVSIFVERLPKALQVPVQAVYEIKGRTFCLVKKGEGFETREVEFSSSNNKFVAITKGLDKDDMVVTHARRYEDLMKLPEELKVDSPADVGPGGAPGQALAGAAAADGPSGRLNPVGAPGAGGPGAGGPGAGAGRGPGGTAGGPPGGGQGAGGGPGGGGARGGGMPNLDTNGDGSLTADELQAIPAQFRDRMMANDTNSDGKLDASELAAMRARFQGGGGGPGGGGPGGAGAPAPATGSAP
jgi:hypothetical protein